MKKNIAKQSTLSVLMTNYNHAHFLPESLGAILAQSYRPAEIIIIDDASTDNSVEIIQKFAQKESIIQLIRNEQNAGVLDNAKRLLNLASGEFVYSAAADDKVLPGLFEKSIELLAMYPDAGLCCSDPVFLDDRTGIMGENQLLLSERSSFFTPDEWCKLSRRQGAWIAGHTSVVNRAALLEAGGFLPDLLWHCDWFAFLVIGFRYGVCYIPESLAMIRSSASSYSASGTRNTMVQREVLGHMLRLLKSPAYRDVLPLFQQSGVLAIFGLEMLRVLLRNTQNWTYLSRSFVGRFLWLQARRALARMSPRLHRRIRVWYRNQAGKPNKETEN